MKRTIGGIEFELVRSIGCRSGRVFWRPKVVQTGYVFEPGVFNGDTRAKLWESLEHTARILGPERWARDTLKAE